MTNVVNSKSKKIGFVRSTVTGGREIRPTQLKVRFVSSPHWEVLLESVLVRVVCSGSHQ